MEENRDAFQSYLRSTLDLANPQEDVPKEWMEEGISLSELQELNAVLDRRLEDDEFSNPDFETRKY